MLLYYYLISRCVFRLISYRYVDHHLGSVGLRSERSDLVIALGMSSFADGDDHHLHHSREDLVAAGDLSNVHLDCSE